MRGPRRPARPPKEVTMAIKHAEVTWKGGLEDGTGTIENIGSVAIRPMNVS